MDVSANIQQAPEAFRFVEKSKRLAKLSIVTFRRDRLPLEDDGPVKQRYSPYPAKAYLQLLTRTGAASASFYPGFCHFSLLDELLQLISPISDSRFTTSKA
ncbi:unnamed protein product [Nippostrongylus brasiliensis]|uniref:Uncharacterized protein n=1 Tax=Nippostrongylus brasiliensis TaxID=27835 RepID=A0A0N4XU67_NIPBR|nr:unnamed protein product [Nippostrongylus brasiliensis]